MRWSKGPSPQCRLLARPQPHAFRLCGSSAWGEATSSRLCGPARKAPSRGAVARWRVFEAPQAPRVAVSVAMVCR